MPTTRRRTRELTKNTQTRPAFEFLRGEAEQPLPLDFSEHIFEQEPSCMPQPMSQGDARALPSRAEFDQAQDQYVQSLNKRKQAKALLTQEMFDDIWDVLHDRMLSKTRTPQFRFWVRKMFTLSIQSSSTLPGYGSSDETDLKPVILHQGRPVAVKHQIYDIIGHCHQLCQHGGRDRTMAHVKALYSWVPKELVAKFVKLCPTCNIKRSSIAQRVSPPVRSCAPTPPPIIACAPTLTQEEISASRVLPPPTPHTSFVLASSDPHLWLSNLACEPGPSFPSPDLQLAPLLRRTESENNSVPRRKPATRTNLPPLLKALSENILDPNAPMERMPYNVPEALQIPPRAQAFVEEDAMAIDPCLLEPSPPCSDVQPEYQRRSTVIAAPIDLPRKSLIRGSISVSSRSSASSTNSGSLSTSSHSFNSYQGPSPYHSQGTAEVHNPLSASISGRLGDTSISSVSSAGQKSENSVNSAQDWELSYCLD